MDVATDVVDSGVDFVGADFGALVGGKGVDAGGELSAQLQDFAATMGRLPRLVAPAFAFEVVFGHAEQLGGDALHHGLAVLDVSQ